MFQILNIDIDLPFDKFENNLRLGPDLEYEYKVANLSRSNTDMYKIIIHNTINGVEFDITAEKTKTDHIVFKNFNIKNFCDSFYIFKPEEDKEICRGVADTLLICAVDAKGSFACIDQDRILLCENGKNISPDNLSIGIVNRKTGSVYAVRDKDKIKGLNEDEDDDTSSYIPTYLINTWLNDNPQFQTKLQNVSQTDKFELMAQYAIYQKNKDMINADQFRDILLQVGTFVDMVGGFKDETIKSLYKFFV